MGRATCMLGGTGRAWLDRAGYTARRVELLLSLEKFPGTRGHTPPSIRGCVPPGQPNSMDMVDLGGYTHPTSDMASSNKHVNFSVTSVSYTGDNTACEASEWVCAVGASGSLSWESLPSDGNKELVTLVPAFSDLQASWASQLDASSREMVYDHLAGGEVAYPPDAYYLVVGLAVSGLGVPTQLGEQEGCPWVGWDGLSVMANKAGAISIAAKPIGALSVAAWCLGYRLGQHVLPGSLTARTYMDQLLGALELWPAAVVNAVADAHRTTAPPSREEVVPKEEKSSIRYRAWAAQRFSSSFGRDACGWWPTSLLVEAVERKAIPTVVDKGDHVVVVWRSANVRDQALNGNNGSATNTDDVKLTAAEKKRRADQSARDKALAKVQQQVGSTIKGSGDYKAVAKVASRALESAKPRVPAAAQWLASMAGVPELGPLAARFGAMGISRLQKMLGSSTLKGSGAYHFAPVASAGVLPTADSSEVHTFSSTVQLGQLKTGAAGVLVDHSFTLSADNRALWPMAAAASRGFQMWCPLQFLLVYKPEVPSGITQTYGTIVMAHLADVNESLPVDRRMASGFEGAAMGMVHEPLLLGVECAKGSAPVNCYFVDNKLTDIEMATHGKITVQVTGTSACENQVVGSLYLVSKLAMSRQRTPDNTLAYAHITRTGGAAATPLGAAASSSVSRGLSASVNSAGTVLTLGNLVPGDILWLSFSYVGVSQVVAQPTLAVTNLEQVMVQNNYGSGFVMFPGAGGSSTNANFSVWYRYTGPPGRTGTLTMSTTSLPSSSTVDVLVQLMGTGLVAADF